MRNCTFCADLGHLLEYLALRARVVDDGLGQEIAVLRRVGERITRRDTGQRLPTPDRIQILERLPTTAVTVAVCARVRRTRPLRRRKQSLALELPQSRLDILDDAPLQRAIVDTYSAATQRELRSDARAQVTAAYDRTLDLRRCPRIHHKLGSCTRLRHVYHH